jgi:hypothetical protein
MQTDAIVCYSARQYRSESARYEKDVRWTASFQTHHYIRAHITA